MKPIRLFIAGDSTAASYPQLRLPMAGWGQMIGRYFTDSVKVVNEARNGRSSKSFIDEGYLNRIVDVIQEGDYLLIQFGHNDQKQESERRTEPFGTYQMYLKKYIDAARSAGATPVLITPVQRRHYDNKGNYVPSHGDYPEAVRQLARQEGVACIDLCALSEEKLVLLGPDGSKSLFVWLQPGEHPNYPNGSEDDTHFNERGACEMAWLVREELLRTGLPISAFLTQENAIPHWVMPKVQLPDKENFPMMKMTKSLSPVWVADLGNGFYRNPVLHADYSDLDIVRVGNDFYMTASSFVSTPGLPILHSNDLVNWTIIGHAIEQLPQSFDGCVRHGDGVWAPSIRYHKGNFYIYFGAPDEGIYMTTAQNPSGPWAPLHLVKAAKGWIDPCPFWDEDGQAYLVHAFASSRCGIKHKLKMCRMSPDGTALLDDGIIVFDGTVNHPTMEGPKLYKRNGYYYIFAPAGGVRTGWQTILRSRSIYGPYEDKIVLHQGHTDVNGPHQGGYIELDSGESWFMHFQDRKAYGRIVHLQPMRWENDWPVMGVDSNGDGIGEPVSVYRKPNTGRSSELTTVPATSDQFENPTLGLQWQWQGNSKHEWLSLTDSPGKLRLMAHPLPHGAATFYDAPGILCQKLPAPEITVMTKLTLHADSGRAHAGLTVFGHQFRYISLESSEDGLRIVLVSGDGRSKEGTSEQLIAAAPAVDSTVYFRVTIVSEAKCSFQYSFDGESYESIGETFDATPGGWVGAKLGLFCHRLGEAYGEGYADFDWIRVEDKDDNG